MTIVWKTYIKYKSLFETVIKVLSFKINIVIPQFNIENNKCRHAFLQTH